MAPKPVRASTAACMSTLLLPGSIEAWNSLSIISWCEKRDHRIASVYQSSQLDAPIAGQCATSCIFSIHRQWEHQAELHQLMNHMLRV